MYPGQKKSAMTWMTQVFLGISVLIFIGAVIFGLMVARDGGRGFKNAVKVDSNNPLSMER